MINGKEDWRRILEKYAYYNLKKTDTTVWFHGASVGEIMSILPLINKFEKDKSIKKILLTSSTLSSASIIAKKPYVRKALKSFQKNFIKKSKLVVVEGRDIGSKIMPNADVKLFFTCSTKEKAKRRLKEFKQLEKKITLKQVEKALILRDKEDTKRKISP